MMMMGVTSEEKDFIDKPEYTGGLDDLLEQRYLDKYIPVQDDDSGIWCVQTGMDLKAGMLIILQQSFLWLYDLADGVGVLYWRRTNLCGGLATGIHNVDSRDVV